MLARICPAAMIFVSSVKGNFARHRETEQYRMIVERKGAVPPV